MHASSTRLGKRKVWALLGVPLVAIVVVPLVLASLGQRPLAPTAQAAGAKQICITVFRVENQADPWTNEETGNFVNGANQDWAPTITWTWNGTITEIQDPEIGNAGEQTGEIVETGSEIIDLAANASGGKAGCHRVIFMRRFIKAGGDYAGFVGLAELQSQKGGPYSTWSMIAKFGSQPTGSWTLAHELGHTVCLADLDTNTGNLMEPKDFPGGTTLTEQQRADAENCAQQHPARLTATAVGGLAELPEVAGTPLAATDSLGANTAILAGVIAGAVAVGAVALGGAAWYARRRTWRA